MTFTGRVRNGVVVFDGPAPLPEGTPVTVAPTVNGVAAQPAGRTPPADGAPPSAPTELPPHVADLLANPPPGLSPRALELIRLSWAENPGAQTLAERWPNALKHTLDLPEDASAQVDHYLYGTPKR